MRDRAWLIVVSLALGACAPTLSPRGHADVTSQAFVTLHGHALRLHLSRPASASNGPLLVYATGDAGWWGKDRAIFAHIRQWGYPAVGFSSREYVHHLGTDTLRPSEVADDYQAIISSAAAALGISTPTRAVLVGKSRGAGLAVAAAAHQPLNGALAGVLVAGLTREEEYVHGRARGSESEVPVMLETYARIEDIGAVPVAVIQSTRDGYVPAAEARRLFGPDTSTRELVAVDARDHNFSGALDVLYRELERSLEWILRR